MGTQGSRLQVRGVGPNVNAVGSVVRLQPDAVVQVRQVLAANNYKSANELPDCCSAVCQPENFTWTNLWDSLFVGTANDLPEFCDCAVLN